MPINVNFGGRACALWLLVLLAITACGGKDSGNQQADSQAAANNVCVTDTAGINWQALASQRCQRLSQYKLFTAAPNQPALQQRGQPFELGSTLFTDHARKYRYFFLPQGKKIQYNASDIVGFPTGTVLAKVFTVPTSDTAESAERIVEVRLMVLRENGWIFIPYRWDEATQDGILAIAGEQQPVAFDHNGKSLSFDYQVPSLLRCQSCHQQTLPDGGVQFQPIGPSIRHLNQTISVNGQAINQIQHWQNLGLITLPENVSPQQMPYAPDWRDQSQALKQRAKAYLDINCAHCHNDRGAAALSGLRLEFWRQEIDYNHGVCNSAHGWRGGGFDIWPGRSDLSSLPLRMQLNGATDRMPPIGRTLADDEANQLIRQWIDSLPYQDCAVDNQ